MVIRAICSADLFVPADRKEHLTRYITQERRLNNSPKKRHTSLAINMPALMNQVGQLFHRPIAL